jgi:hypothetical protein
MGGSHAWRCNHALFLLVVDLKITRPQTQKHVNPFHADVASRLGEKVTFLRLLTENSSDWLV